MIGLGAATLFGGLASGLGSLIGSGTSANATLRANRENIAFQKEQNEIERERADNTLLRTATDAHRAGLSAFDAQSIPLGETSAPQNDVQAVGNAYGSIGQSVANSVNSTLGYMLQSATLEHQKNVDKEKLHIADITAQADNSLKNAQTEIANIQAQIAQKQNMNEETRLELENQLKSAQVKATLANETKTLADTAIAQSKEKREQALHQIDVNTRATQLDQLYHDYNNKAIMDNLEQDLKRQQYKLNEQQMKYYREKLGLEIDNLTLEAMEKLENINQKSFGLARANKQYRKQYKKFNY